MILARCSRMNPDEAGKFLLAVHRMRLPRPAVVMALLNAEALRKSPMGAGTLCIESITDKHMIEPDADQAIDKLVGAIVRGSRPLPSLAERFGVTHGL